MTINKDVKSAAKPPDEKQVATSTNILVNTKAFHQYFTLYFLVILLVIVVSLSSVLFFFIQQNNHSQAIIDEQVIPLQNQFLQQSYLIHSNNLLEKMLQSANVAELPALQQDLRLNSKKLSLLTSLNQTSYQQWLSNNNQGTELITAIVENNRTNNELKNKALLQLDTILDAITIQLDKRNTAVEQAKLLTQGQNNLASIVTLMASLNLQAQQSSFPKLRTRLEDMFNSDYSKRLANIQQSNQGIADIVRDFIRLEDHLFKSDFLDRWQQQLVLLKRYHQQLAVQQQELSIILGGVVEKGNSSISNAESLTLNKKITTKFQLPLPLLILLSVTFFSVAILLLLMWLRLKTYTDRNTHCIKQALDGEFDAAFIDNKSAINKLAKERLLSAETKQLVEKIFQRNIIDSAELDNLLPTAKIVHDSALEKASVIAIEQCLFTEQNFKALQLMAIKQQILLGAHYLSSKTKFKRGTQLAINFDDIYQAYKQGRKLARRIELMTYHQHLQSNKAVLSLVDSNFFALVQAALFNQHTQLIENKNTISATFDEKILAEVNLDAELFSELFNVFIELLLKNQEKVTLALTWQLIDQNTGQQKVCFSGQIHWADKVNILPVELINITDVEHGKSDGNSLANYFNTLLNYLHGEDLIAILTEQGYQLSFTLPLTVTNDQSAQHAPTMSLPANLTNIKHQITQLAENYLPMPVEVLLAVTSPDNYQCLQQLLQSMGLTVTFVVTESSQDIHWRSGRFAVLITELDIDTFVEFSANVSSSDKRVLPRGVFSLNGAMPLTDKPEDFALWRTGNLTADSDVKTLLSALHPWLIRQASVHSSPTKVGDEPSEQLGIIDSDNEVQLSLTAIENDSKKTTDKRATTCFNFKRYIQHQGSAELALYMLDDYTKNNEVLVTALVKALANKDVTMANAIIQALTVNSKILAADELLQICHHWHELLTKQALENNTKLQVKLLGKTQQAVKAISQYADLVV